LSDPLLQVEDLTKTFAPRTQWFRAAPVPSRPALDGVSLSLDRGDVLGIVGESGSGKSTLARCITVLERPDRGRVVFDGTDLTQLDPRTLRRIRRRIQIVFQDPFSSLNPRITVGDALSEVLAVHRLVPRNAIPARVRELLDLVGLSSTAVGSYPADFSGGQRQRICIARALAAEPELLIADEAVSALDVSIQAQILNLLLDLRQELGLSMIFISHNLYVVRRVARRFGVMFGGRLIEMIPERVPLHMAQHPYTQALLAAAPRLDRPIRSTERRDADLVPTLPAHGCPYRERCPHAFQLCIEVDPPLLAVDGEPSRDSPHLVACHLANRNATSGVASDRIFR
jgi:oligopeptide transport system ATP-binding protein